MPDSGARRTAKNFNPIRELSGKVARKIAAGEVIDRPAAVIRELIDNAIDAEATEIDVEIVSGGIESIRVRDNGCGMTKDDLALCTQTHTTSKIITENDLLSLSTLGFRGEALSSIHAVSRLEIISARDGTAWKLSKAGLEPNRLPRGTVIQINGLFENFPARRQFLKKPASEASLCRQVVQEKALAWPGISFRYSSQGSVPLVLPAVRTLRERVLAALAPKEPESFFHVIENKNDGFSFSVIAGTPETARANRRSLMVYVNGRRIQEYGLIQALEYGAEGYFPNGTHPFAVLFITIDPSLVDFNIHPAKKEVRFRDPKTLHHAVSSTVKTFYRNETISGIIHDTPETQSNMQCNAQKSTPSLFSYEPHTLRNSREPYPSTFTRDSFASYTDTAERLTDPAQLAAEAVTTGILTDDALHEKLTKNESFRYIGQTLGTFLIVETHDRLLLIDQHAAHERILYDKLRAHTGAIQELLVPYKIETASRNEDALLKRNKDALATAGFILENAGNQCWLITAVPARWKGSEEELHTDLLESAREPQDMINHLLARSACRAACKDGDILDPHTAREIAEQTLALPEPRCPHGRPLWVELTKSALFDCVKRT